MRTTVSIPDDIYADVKAFILTTSFSQFVRDAVQQHLATLKRDALLREMAEGYRAEAKDSSLDPEWSDIETEGW